MKALVEYSSALNWITEKSECRKKRAEALHLGAGS